LVWWREKSVATSKSIWKSKKGVIMSKGFDTKLRRNRRLNLLVNKFFLFICVGQYKIIKVEITTLE
jgi:hypothetical protein